MWNFDQTVDEMKRHGMPVPQDKVYVSVADAEAVLQCAMTYFLRLQGRDLVWLPEYSQVAEWLADNKGKGLFLYGNCGRGKSLLSRYVLPAILLKFCKKVVSVFDVQAMNKDVDYVLSKHIVSIDDIGTEEQSVRYGERRLAFAEVMDAAEKYDNLVIVSSNLYAADIGQVYGDRVLDRIKATTRRVLFEGESLRM